MTVSYVNFWSKRSTRADGPARYYFGGNTVYPLNGYFAHCKNGICKKFLNEDAYSGGKGKNNNKFVRYHYIYINRKTRHR